MKRLVTCLMLTALMLASAQRRQNDNSADISLAVGSVTVRLGMPESDALLRFQTAGCRIVGEGDNKTVSVGDLTSMIGFQNGKLKYATREWNIPKQSQMDVVVRALTDLASHGGRSCLITTDRMNTPSGSGDTVFVVCGSRSLMFVNGVSRGVSESVPVVEIQERIGEP